MIYKELAQFLAQFLLQKKYLLKKILSWDGQMAESKIVNNLVWLLMFDVGGKSDTGVE